MRSFAAALRSMHEVMKQRMPQAGTAPGATPSPAEGPTSWRVVLAQRTLPLPVLRPITVGSDPRNGLQLAHSSVRPFHCRLARKGATLEVTELAGSGALHVDGAPTSRALLRGGEELRIGEIAIRVERGEVAAAVVSRRDDDFGAEFLRVLKIELARLPWLAISIAVHALLYFGVGKASEAPPPEEHVVLRAAVDARENAMPPVEDTPPPPVEPDVLQSEVDLPEPVPERTDPEDATDPPGEPAAPLSTLTLSEMRTLGVGGASGGAAGFGSRGIQIGQVNGPLADVLRELRTTGVDLVFLVDTTASMEPFLDAAKRTVDDLITDLADLIPNLRIGMVAYRDRGDEYLVKAVRLGTDRYRILNFLQDLRAFGGGDMPEAVLDAAEYAFEKLEWRPKARRVVLLVADAPPHQEDVPKLRLRLRNETHRAGTVTVLSTIYTGGNGFEQPQQDAENALREIAKLGNGEFTYMANPAQIRSQIVGLTIGGRLGADAEQALRERRNQNRQHVVDAMVKNRDTDGLIRKLKIVPVEPLVVQALVTLDSPGVALRCFDLMTSRTAAPATREAALYILKRMTGYRGSFDFDEGLAVQQKSVDELKRAIEDTFRSRVGRRRGG